MHSEHQLAAENATLRLAVTLQTIALVGLCLVGALKVAFFSNLNSGDVAVDLTRRTIDIRFKASPR